MFAFVRSLVGKTPRLVCFSPVLWRPFRCYSAVLSGRAACSLSICRHPFERFLRVFRQGKSPPSSLPLHRRPDFVTCRVKVRKADLWGCLFSLCFADIQRFLALNPYSTRGIVPRSPAVKSRICRPLRAVPSEPVLHLFYRLLSRASLELHRQAARRCSRWRFVVRPLPASPFLWGVIFSGVCSLVLRSRFSCQGFRCRPLTLCGSQAVPGRRPPEFAVCLRQHAPCLSVTPCLSARPGFPGAYLIKSIFCDASPLSFTRYGGNG